MRVALDCRLAWMGGVGRYIRTLLEVLAERGDVEIVAVTSEAGALDGVAPPSVTRAVTGLRPFSVAEQLKFPGLLRELEVDLFHAPYYNFPLRSSVPLVVTIHDLVWWQRRFVPWMSPAAIYSRFMLRASARRATSVIAVSERTASEIRARFGRSDVRVVHNALPAWFEQATAAMRPAPSPRLLYVGTAKPWKRVDVLFDALTVLRARGVRAEASVAGTPARNRNADVGGLIQARGLDDSVTVHGPLDDQAMARLYLDAGIYVMPSEYEGFGLTTLEAMRAGCAVVAADLPVHREVAGDAAAYFTPGDPRALAAALEPLLANEAARRVAGIAARQRSTCFPRLRLGEETVRVYRDVVAGARTVA